MITEEEMNSLLDQLKLEQFHSKEHPERFIGADGKADVTALHKAFHYRVVRWAQAVGFQGYRS